MYVYCMLINASTHVNKFDLIVKCLNIFYFCFSHFNIFNNLIILKLTFSANIHFFYFSIVSIVYLAFNNLENAFVFS